MMGVRPLAPCFEAGKVTGEGVDLYVLPFGLLRKVCAAGVAFDKIGASVLILFFRIFFALQCCFPDS